MGSNNKARYSNNTQNTKVIFLGDDEVNNRDRKYFSIKTPFDKPLFFLDELIFLETHWPNCKLCIFLSDSRVFSWVTSEKDVYDFFKSLSLQSGTKSCCTFQNGINPDFCFYLNTDSLKQIREHIKEFTPELFIGDIFLLDKNNHTVYECHDFYDGIWTGSLFINYQIDQKELKNKYMFHSRGMDLLKNTNISPFVDVVRSYFWGRER